jgi:hypothetical protein
VPGARAKDEMSIGVFVAMPFLAVSCVSSEPYYWMYRLSGKEKT